MPLPSSYSGGNLTTIRAGGNHLPFVVPLAPVNLFQAHPSVSASGLENESITFASITGFANLLTDLTVIISPSTDWKADLRDKRDSCFITYVRKAATSTVLYIGRTSFQWTTSDYVTVISDFRPQHKPYTIDGETILHDADVSYRAPLPRIYALYANIAEITSGSTVNYSPTPSISIMNSAASSGTWAWSTISPSGTVTVTASTSATPTFSLTEGWWWLQARHTDSAGNVGRLSVPVYAYATAMSASSLFNGATQIDLDRDNDSYYGASITSIASTSAWYEGMPLIIFRKSYNTDATVTSDVQFYGWLVNNNQTRAINSGSGRAELSYNAEFGNIAYFMAQFQVDATRFELQASPSDWTTVYALARCTPFDCAWALYSENMTSVGALSAFSDINDYQFTVIQTEEGTLFEAINRVMERAAVAKPDMTTQGELIYTKEGRFLTTSSARNALTTLWTITGQDYPAITVNAEYAPVVGKAYLGAGNLDITNGNTPRIVEAHAPALFLSAPFREKHDGYILDKDLSAANLLIEGGRLAYNFWANSQPNLETLNITLTGGYMAQIPQRGAWVILDLSNATTLNAIAWTSAIRWQIMSVTVSYGIDNKSAEVRLIVRRESGGLDNYAQYANPARNNTAPPTLDIPTGLDDPFLDDWEDILDNYPPYSPPYYEDPTQPEDTRQETKPVPTGTYRAVVSFTNSDYTTIPNLIMVDGTKYRIKVGQSLGIIRPLSLTYDFTASEAGWQEVIGIPPTPPSDPATPRAFYTASLGWTAYDYTLLGYDTRVEIRIYIETPLTPSSIDITVNSVSFTDPLDVYVYSVDNATYPAVVDTLGTVLAEPISVGSNTITVPLSGTFDAGIRVDLFSNAGVLLNTAYLESIAFESSVIRYSDPCAYWDTPTGLHVAYGSGEGLLVGMTDQRPSNGTFGAAQPSQAYYGYYTADATDDANPFQLKFFDPDADYGNNRDIWKMVCEVDIVT